MRLSVFESGSFDPYWNLALEEQLMYRCGEDERVLYLWQNDKTVVIGRNQDAQRECPIRLLAEEGVRLARRESGGGAVYHDLGNLNFSFFARRKNYDTARQTRVVLEALLACGIHAEFSGRNDILLDGKKISGSAFRQSGEYCCHHGTIMVDVDKTAMSRYLCPGMDKLDSKAVASVYARVANLREIRSEIHVDGLKRSLREAFERTFAGRAEELSLSETDLSDVRERRRKYANPGWILGEKKENARVLSRRFDWGGVELCLRVEANRVTDVQVWTDAMEPELPERLREKLLGVRFTNSALAQALFGQGVEDDLAVWLRNEPLGG